jgi:hypothetical protein
MSDRHFPVGSLRLGDGVLDELGDGVGKQHDRQDNLAPGAFWKLFSSL